MIHSRVSYTRFFSKELMESKPLSTLTNLYLVSLSDNILKVAACCLKTLTLCLKSGTK